MKRILALFVAVIWAGFGFAQQSVMERWSALLDKPEVVSAFDGLFNSIGLDFYQNDEQFMVFRDGEGMRFEAGLDPSRVDYVVQLDAESVEELLQFGADDEISQREINRIMTALFTPLTQASLNADPLAQRGLMLSLGGIDKHMHVVLDGPQGRRLREHTLLFHKGYWYVIPGLHGQADRLFTLDAEAAVDFQRHMFAAQEAGTKKAWREYRKWYLDWREGVSKKR